MKKIIKALVNIMTKPFRTVANFCRKVTDKVNRKAVDLSVRSKSALCTCSGEGYVDTAVKIIIGVVVGSVILVALYALFKNVVLKEMTTDISNMFNYSGT